MERPFRVTWPQQTEAELIKTAMLGLDRTLSRENMQARLVMMIHDSIWVEAPAAEEDRVRSLIRRAMTEARELEVPIEVDPKLILQIGSTFPAFLRQRTSHPQPP